VGLDVHFMKTKIVPPALLSQLEDRGGDTDGVLLRVASIVSRVFNWDLSTIFSTEPLEIDTSTIRITRFKKARNASERRVNAYTVYAHYLALLLIECTSELPKKAIPTDATAVRKEIIDTYGSITLKNVLHYVWDLGVPVLPLNDQGAFHGACWRVDNRNVIVLKQQTMSESRWLFDFLHEFRHAGQNPDQEEFETLEVHDIGQGKKHAQEEQIASTFAGNVLLDCRAEELTQKCVNAAHGSIELLKSVVPTIARQENVATDALANYIAYRLSLQGFDWWGSAYNLQTLSISHWQIARDVLRERADLEKLNEVDRDLLLRALSKAEV
jgi:Zn-dependent peptidase ImmA (M78 family)